MTDIGSARLGIDGRPEAAQEEEDHHHHEREGDDERELHVVHRVADRDRPVVEQVQLDGLRQRGLEARQQRQDVLGHLDRVRARLALDRQDDRALVDVPGRGLVVLDAVDGRADLAQAHGMAVAVRDDGRQVRLGGHELAVGLNGVRLLLAVERAGGQVHVRVLHRAGHLVNPDPAVRQLGRVELDAHGVLLRAVDEHLRHAAHLGDALRHERLAEFVELVERQVRRGERDEQDRLVGRVDLLVRGRRGHVLRELPLDGADRRLHVLRGGVEAAAEAELERDLRHPDAAGRGHRVNAGDRGELLLQRRRHRGGHRLRVRAGQRGGDEDDREVHVRQVAHRQQPEAEDAEEQDRHHHQRGRDRPADGEFR